MNIGSFEIPATATHICTFLIGVACGAFANYFGELFTDKRRMKESDASRKKKWAHVKKEMPELIKEMKADWNDSANRVIRTFYVTNKGLQPSSMEHSSFYYNRDDYNNLDAKVSILENHGFVQLVGTRGLIKEYQVMEDFVESLLGENCG